MASPGRKSSMMERLRRLHVLPPSDNTPSPSQVPAQNAPNGPNAPEPKKTLKSALKSKSQSQFPDEGLDLQLVNSKLEAIALERSQSQEEEEDEDAESEVQQVEDVSKLAKKHDEKQLNTGLDGETDNTTAKAKNSTIKVKENEPAASERSKSTCPSIVITPPDDEPAEGSTEPTDFQLFIQKAEVAENKRKEQGQTAIPKSKPQPALNQFYSNNLASSSSVPNPSKLAEIQETAEGDDNSHTGESKDHAIESPVALSSNRTSTTASSGSNDFAATEHGPARVNSTSLGRHVSFSEPDKIRRAVSNNSARYDPKNRRESPSPEGDRRKSIRALFRACLRWT